MQLFEFQRETLGEFPWDLGSQDCLLTSVGDLGDKLQWQIKTGHIKVDIAVEMVPPPHKHYLKKIFFVTLNSSKIFETADLNFECDSKVLE